uniref:SH3b domain-containing protein n=1 Tax=uncultured bacterium Contigcl_1774 TaxID=1393661 RepID=W0FRM9_9BACT|nr:hypothetical protein [uncultured bacterium Contigcl_1774]
MRKGFSVICAAVMTLALCAPAWAEITHPAGAGQMGYDAVVISKNVSVRPTTNANATALKRLSYGDHMAVMSVGNGWCEVYLSETEGLSGYVLEDYILIDPAYITIEESTPVYAWQATNAKRVGLISKGETYPIIRMEGNWLLISLRGAAGWMLRPDRDEASGTARMKASNVLKVAKEQFFRENSWIRESELNNYYIFADFDAMTREWTVTFDNRNGSQTVYTVSDDNGAVYDGGGEGNG